jgi:winged helix-turn helix protein
MREMSVTEQRYKAVLAVIGEGPTVSEVATDWGVSRRTLHRWLVRYEGDGLEGLNNRSHRPAQSRHQMPPTVEAMVLEMRYGEPCRPCAGEPLSLGPGRDLIFKVTVGLQKGGQQPD